MANTITNSPRLYVSVPLKKGQTLTLDPKKGHYLCRVLRMGKNDTCRLFNGRDGEWAAQITIPDPGRGVQISVTLLTRPQPMPKPARHLIFSPIKKNRMDMLIEKAVELGATHLHPVLCERTQNRQINRDRMLRQIAEAAEQSERLHLPLLSPVSEMDECLKQWPAATALYVCLERDDAKSLTSYDLTHDAAVLVGPEGGFSEREKEALRSYRPVSLGPNILRTETAALAALAVLHMSCPPPETQPLA